MKMIGSIYLEADLCGPLDRHELSSGPHLKIPDKAKKSKSSFYTPAIAMHGR